MEKRPSTQEQIAVKYLGVDKSDLKIRPDLLKIIDEDHAYLDPEYNDKGEIVVIKIRDRKTNEILYLKDIARQEKSKMENLLD